MMHQWASREEYWGYLATFLYTTQTAPIREPYLDLDAILKGKDFFVLTTNQDTQFVKLYPEEKVAEIQGDHRFFQCAGCCTDDTWDAVEPVAEMVKTMGENTAIPTELIPRCPHCGGPMEMHMEAGPYFLPDTAARQRMQAFLHQYHGKKLAVLELGIGWRNQLIKAPLMRLTAQEPNAVYVTINLGEIYIADDIKERSFGLDGPLSDILSALRKACSV